MRPNYYFKQALEPHISKDIMSLHHSKHHQTYVNGLNAAEEAYAKTSSVKEKISLQAALKFNGGGTCPISTQAESPLRINVNRTHQPHAVLDQPCPQFLWWRQARVWSIQRCCREGLWIFRGAEEEDECADCCYSRQRMGMACTFSGFNRH